MNLKSEDKGMCSTGGPCYKAVLTHVCDKGGCKHIFTHMCDERGVQTHIHTRMR